MEQKAVFHRPALTILNDWIPLSLRGKDFSQMFSLTLSEKPYGWNRNTGVP